MTAEGSWRRSGLASPGASSGLCRPLGRIRRYQVRTLAEPQVLFVSRRTRAADGATRAPTSRCGADGCVKILRTCPVRCSPRTQAAATDLTDHRACLVAAEYSVEVCGKHLKNQPLALMSDAGDMR